MQTQTSNNLPPFREIDLRIPIIAGIVIALLHLFN